MKKQLTVILLSALILSGCASGRMGNPGAIMAGASIGGSLGSSIGGLIGDNNHGWRAVTVVLLLGILWEPLPVRLLETR